jgi:hypothetical protein
LAGRANAVIVAATDNNRQGEVYARRIQEIVDGPALVSRGHGRAPTIGTRTLAPPELAELEEEKKGKTAWSRAACRPRERENMRKEREKDRCRMPGQRVKGEASPAFRGP